MDQDGNYDFIKQFAASLDDIKVSVCYWVK